MDPQYSIKLDLAEYDPDNLCPGIDLRLHVAADLEDIGIFRCQEDWRRLVGPLENPFKGPMGPRFSFISITVPDCLPERLEITSYALEFAFHQDSTYNHHLMDEVN